MEPDLVVGAYDRTVDGALARAIAALPAHLQAHCRGLTTDETPSRLADLLHEHLISAIDAATTGDAGAAAAIELTNSLIAAVRRATDPDDMVSEVPSPLRVLTSISRDPVAPALPARGLAQPWLFTAGRSEPALLAELRAELACADQVDVLVSFITRSGVRRLLDILQQVTGTGADGRPRLRLRIITTTYTGATDADAVDTLARLSGCEVKVSLDGSRTRLHAKSWIFHRDSGSGTAYIGSANLSQAALAGGIEWTIKIAEQTQRTLFQHAAAQFAALWEDPEFQHYNPHDPAVRAGLREALARESGTATAMSETAVIAFDWIARPFQRAMLERLAHEREMGRRRNLIVAATGTGKTVVAALDYRRLCEHGSPPTLLFLAHRVEILKRALATFRSVLRPIGIGSFGDLLAGGEQPQRLDHLFATIDSVHARGLLATPDRWHMVIIDECHRMGPETRFDEVAKALKPHLLLGLTATPERADGKPILHHFDPRPDGSPAVELRLWDALDQQLVVPFEYYACDDQTDFRTVPWGQVGEQAAVAQAIYAVAEERAREVLAAWRGKVGDPRRCRALAFCVTVEHAQAMAAFFTANGIPAVCVHGGSNPREREEAPERLSRGDIAVITTVDLYNEGIDIPSIDTLLFLRPTQSPVVFQQQLGRGLRHHEAAGRRKESCLVLDFVGRHRAEFRFDRLLAPITGLSRRELVHAVERGAFPLPPGCHLHLEPQTRIQVLASLKEAVQQNWRRLCAELRGYVMLRGAGQVRLVDFLRDQAIDLEDLYRPRTQGGTGWTALRRACGLLAGTGSQEEVRLGQRLGRLLHADDRAQIAFFRRVAETGAAYRAIDSRERRRLLMLAYQMDKAHATGGEGLIALLGSEPAIGSELRDLADLLALRSDLPERPIPGFEAVPLCLHAGYSRFEILAALGRWTETQRPFSNTGIEWNREERWGAFFVTLDKSDGFAGRIAYDDCALSPTRFQWQTQTATSPTSEVGRRYLDAPGNGWRFLLFVQERKGLPFRALGPLRRPLQHHGTKPVTIVWELEVAIPQELFVRYSPAR